MSNDVLSPNERLITVILAVLLHLIMGVFLYRCTVYDPPIPPPKPAGFTIVSFGRPAHVQQLPTTSSSELEEEFAPSVTAEQISTENTETEATTAPNVESVSNTNSVSVPKTEQKILETTPQKLKENTEEEITKEQANKENTKNKSKPQQVEETNATNTNQDGREEVKEATGNTNDPNQSEKIGEEGSVVNGIVGWRWVSPPNVKDVMREQGKILFEVTLDEQGNVIQVEVKEKSPTITYATLTTYKSALFKTKFERSSSTKPKGNSVGPITVFISVD